ncbi:MAG: serine hydrolase domain-containing protein [Fibrobacterota bacterium]
MRYEIIIVFLSVLSAFFCGCAEKESSHSHIIGDLSHVVDSVRFVHDAPGALAAIRFADGEEIFTASGAADTAHSRELTPQHFFRIGSAAKTMTATAVLILYQEGLVSLDSSVSTYLPGMLPDSGEDITVRMLLHHTSGLYDYISCPYEGSYFFYVYSDAPTREWEPEELVEIACAEGLAHPPGEEFLYSNTNYILLGLLIEEVSHMSYGEFLTEHIFQPLGMNQTKAVEFDSENPFLAQGYFERDEDGVLYDYTDQSASAVWSAGNAVSTPGDLLIWIRALMDGTLLNEQTYEEQFSLVSTGHGSDAYGLGVEVRDNSRGHAGSVLGYQTMMYRRKDCDIIVYTNCYYQSKPNLSGELFNALGTVIDRYYD